MSCHFFSRKPVFLVSTNNKWQIKTGNRLQPMDPARCQKKAVSAVGAP
jgi:hypothetical protein